MTGTDEKDMNETIIEQAADWVARLHGGDDNESVRAELQTWLSRDPENQRVFERMTGVLERSAVLRETTPATAENIATLPPRRTRRVTAYFALAAGIAAFAAMFILSLPDVSVQTTIGERRSVPLQDGSVLHLNAMSDVKVTMNSDSRYVELSSGEVLFEVASDPDRPFVVDTGSLQIEVLGTAFSVTAYDDSRNVSVVEGLVAVRGTGPDKELGRGEQVNFHDGVLGAPLPVEVSQIASWRQGWLYHERQPLQVLVDRLNRQYHGQIEIRDAALAATDVNVILRLEGREKTLNRLQQLLPLIIEESPGERITIRARN